MSRKDLTLGLLFVLVIALVASACSSADLGSSVPKEYDQGNEAPSEGDFTSGERIVERKVIYEALLSVKVPDVDKAVRDLNGKAADLGGYVADSNRDNARDLPTARITYRIPQARYTDFMAYARNLGEPGTEWIDSTDVTEEFVDLEARLTNRLVHEERLLAMLSKTESVEELLAVERELARVREDIEIIEGRLRYLGEKVDMATVTISLSQQPGATEVPGIKPVGISETLRRALKAIVTSATLFLDVLSFLVIAIAALLPFAVPVLAILWLIFYLRRKKKKQAQG